MAKIVSTVGGVLLGLGLLLGVWPVGEGCGSAYLTGSGTASCAGDRAALRVPALGLTALGFALMAGACAVPATARR